MPEIPGIDELPGSTRRRAPMKTGTAQTTVDSDTLVPAGTGSGFIVDEGHVITNAHVVGRGS